MPFYESVFIARQDVTATQVDGLAENFEKIIADNGGAVPKKESWGLRTLAYRIKKNRKGYYVLLNIDAPPAAIQEMERQMQLNEDVIRYMTIRVDELDEGPSAVMKAKERGDERGGGRRGRDDRRPRDGDKTEKAEKAKKTEKTEEAEETEKARAAADDKAAGKGKGADEGDKKDAGAKVEKSEGDDT